MKKKILVSAVAAALVLCCAIGGTLAWLTAQTNPVINTFTVGNVDLTLTETTGPTYKMVPGCTIKKDPTVTVTKDSEDCWLFVKVEKSTNFDTFMTYAMADGWEQLKNAEGQDVADVFYREVKTGEANQEFAVLKDNQVAVKDSVDKSLMDGLTKETYPTLTFTAYAVQQHKGNAEGTVENFTPAEAWKQVSPGA